MRVFLFLILLMITIPLYAQEYNTIVTDPKSDKPMLIGHCTVEAFADTNFSWWFNSAYELYEYDEEIVEQLKGKFDDIEITIVMATWCSDSRREVPRFYRLMDELEYPVNDITLISVNRDKEGLEDEVDELEIELVPTFIFYEDGVELGRVIESPLESLEEDLLVILNENSQQE